MHKVRTKFKTKGARYSLSEYYETQIDIAKTNKMKFKWTLWILTVLLFCERVASEKWLNISEISENAKENITSTTLGDQIIYFDRNSMLTRKDSGFSDFFLHQVAPRHSATECFNHY